MSSSLTILDLILIVMSSVFFVFLFIYLVKLIKANRQIRQLMLDKAIIMAELAKLLDAQSSKSIEETQGFLKFVSDSRDWAFEYIEDIQQALRAYDIALSMDDAKILNEAYAKLIGMLPDDDVVK